MVGKKLEVSKFLPLKPADFQVLLVLSEGPLHAYGICKAVEEQLKGQVHLEIGSLYRMMGRLTTAGLIEEVEGPDDPQGSPAQRRRTYQITRQGRLVARAEARRLEEVLEVAREKDLLAEGGGA
ncbi:MAG TPA: helix-turn-helix transcriptional regulator [Acidobacteriota bacterium]|nr:helix-turn-helix transcriptional regulator [Acidobacteriota bacterium]